MSWLGFSAAYTPYPPPISTSPTIEAIMMRRRRFFDALPFVKLLPLLDIQDPPVTSPLRLPIPLYEHHSKMFPLCWYRRRKGRLVREPCALFQGGTAQAKRVANHRNAAETHGCARDHRVQQPVEEWIKHSRCNRYTQNVVKKREAQILFDIRDRIQRQFACTHNSTQVALHQGNPPALDGHVRSSAHGNPDVRRRQRRRIINPIAGHCHHVSLLAKFLDELGFLRWKHLGANLIQPQLFGNGPCRFFVVTG